MAITVLFVRYLRETLFAFCHVCTANINGNGTAVKIRLRYPAQLSGQCPDSLAWDLSR
jgi:hypothetical protein